MKYPGGVWKSVMALFLAGTCAVAQDPPPPDAPAPSAPIDTGVFRVVGTVPLDGDPLAGPLVVFFSEPIAFAPPAESASAQPIVFDPPLIGTFHTGTNYITFVPMQLPSGAVIEATISEHVHATASGAQLDPAQRRRIVSTSPFEPQRWGVLNDTPDGTRFGIVFPFEVNPQSLAERVAFKALDGQSITAQVVDKYGDSSYVFLLGPVAQWPIRFRIAEGLMDATGNLATTRAFEGQYPVGPAMTMSANFHDLNATEQKIAVRFSSEVDSKALATHLHVTDLKTEKEVPYVFSSESTDDLHFLIVKLENSAEIRLRLTATAGIESRDKNRLVEDVSVDITHDAPPLEVQYTWWGYEGRDGLSLRINLNEPLQPAATPDVLAKHLSVQPPIENMKVDYGYNADQVRILGDWASETSYTVTFTEGLPLTNGRVLKQALATESVSEKIPEYAGFAHEGLFYFPRRSGMALGLETRNVEKSAVDVYRLFPSNLPVALSALDEGKGGYDFNEQWSEKISSVETPVAGKKDTLATTTLSLDKIFPADRRGVFGLQANSKEATGTRIVVFTDIGALAHWKGDELAIYVHELYTIAPIAGAKVTVYSAKNQLMGETRTGADGLAQLKNFETRLGEPSVVVIEHGNDYTFLQLTHRDDDTAPMAVATDEYDRDGYDAYLYADRDLYRPGETAHLRWIVRTNYGDALANVPLVFEVLKPNQRVLMTSPITLSELGTGGIEVPTHDTDPTGRYEARIKVPGKEEPIGRYGFKVEDFVPNRMKAEMEETTERWGVDAPLTTTVRAMHLFGAPASDRKAQASVSFKRGAAPFPQWEGFRFDNDTDYNGDYVSAGDAMTDAEGRAKFEFKFAPSPKMTFPVKATVFGEVFELGGRSVAASKATTYFPSAISLGVSAAPGKEAGTVDVSAAAVANDGSASSLGTVKVTLERQVWSYYVRRYYSNLEPNWSESFTPVQSVDVVLTAGRGSAVFEVKDYGYYRVRVHSDATVQYSTQSFFSFDGEVQLADAARPRMIKLTLDMDNYAVGETATLRLESPFDGKAVVVLQSEDTHRMMAVDVTNGVGTLEIPVTKEMYPNVWAEVTAIHAVKEGESRLYPYSSFALVNLKVEDPWRALNVDLGELPEQILPATETAVTVKVTNAAGTPVVGEVTLAAVDEGIHGLTNYQDPAPYTWFGRSRRIAFNRAHYYDKVLYNYEKAPPGGGSPEAEMARRMAPPLENWIKPVALWSGAVRTNSAGEARVVFQVPEFTGQLRLVAVAASPTATGAKKGNVFVRRTFMLQTSMPRFLLPGDTAQCRAVVYNHSDADCTALISWTPTGALGGVAGSQTVSVPAHGEASVLAPVSAGAASGQGLLGWNAIFSDAVGAELYRGAHDAPIPVQQPAAYRAEGRMVAVPPGQTMDFVNDAYGEDARAHLSATVAAHPVWRLKKALEHVVGYPYGCIEQTTSRVLPVYALRRYESLVNPTLPGSINLESYLRAGIDRLFTMQTESGGLGFWPGAKDPHPYGSVYALHFLTTVKNDGEYAVPEEAFEALQKYVRGLVSPPDTRPSGLFLRAYALYTLVLGGDPGAVQQISQFDDEAMPQAARHLLAAALAQGTQDPARVQLYLSEKPMVPYAPQENDATFSSQLRDSAVELFARMKAGAPLDQTLPAATALVDQLESNPHGSTQERAFVLLTLAEFMDALAGPLQTAAGTVSSAEASEPIGPSDVRAYTHDGPGGKFTVANSGGAPLFVNLRLGGIPLKPETEAVSEGLKISRRYLTSTGAPFAGPVFAQSGAYLVEMTLDAPRSLKHVVAVDLLPAGLEIQNPRLQDDALPQALPEGRVSPTHVELRDDRLIAAFDELPAGVNRFYYIVRAVTPGTYQHPGANAECMYDPRIRATIPAGSLEIAAQ